MDPSCSERFAWFPRFCTEEGLSRFDGYAFTNYGVEQGTQGAPAPRVVYASEKVTPAPMFTVVVPEDKDSYAKAITSLLESRDSVTAAHLQR